MYLSGTIILELLYKERYSLSKQDLQKAKFLNEFMASELLLAPKKESLSVLYEEQLEFLKPQIAACKRLSVLLLEQEYLEHSNLYDLLNG